MRYSHSELELSYEYHTEQELGPGLHWMVLLIGTGAVVALTYNALIYFKQPVWLWSILVVLLWVGQSFLPPSPAPVLAAYAGEIRLHYTAGEASCYFSPIKLTDQTPLPIGAELALPTVQSIRVRMLPNSDSDQPSYGLVEVQLTQPGPWLLFAQLPTAQAANQAATLLRDLTGIPALTNMNPPSASGIIFLRYLGRQYYKLSHGKLR
ncbi:hypothetical protein [Hymenobacter cellulosivorans]|uniref:Uncharacterized protein n=1 Tax=Hymenobacter cellulosivorans TaxID=2932249 RepID=A0ABY4F766_9BACT|nr:hypothetical protein [Hymenobacter cellulosivorans]UOQ51942.1 hypothetical protein MUN80_19530 [Hymenobacter cellulosivorans]